MFGLGAFELLIILVVVSIVVIGVVVALNGNKPKQQ